MPCCWYIGLIEEWQGRVCSLTELVNFFIRYFGYLQYGAWLLMLLLRSVLLLIARCLGRVITSIERVIFQRLQDWRSWLGGSRLELEAWSRCDDGTGFAKFIGKTVDGLYQLTYRLQSVVALGLLYVKVWYQKKSAISRSRQQKENASVLYRPILLPTCCNSQFRT